MNGGLLLWGLETSAAVGRHCGLARNTAVESRAHGAVFLKRSWLGFRCLIHASSYRSMLLAMFMVVGGARLAFGLCRLLQGPWSLYARMHVGVEAPVLACFRDFF